MLLLFVCSSRKRLWFNSTRIQIKSPTTLIVSKGRVDPPYLQPLRVFRLFFTGGPVPARNADPRKLACALTRTLIRKPNLAKGLCPDRAAQGVSRSLPRPAGLCRPSLRSVLSAPASPPLQGCEIPLSLRLATPAFARWRSACTCRVSTRKCSSQTQGGSTHDHHQHCHPHQRKP